MKIVASRFEHDCEHCTFLGLDGDADVYVCPQGGMATVIRRYGDDGPEYESGAMLYAGLPEDLRSGIPEDLHRQLRRRR